MRKCFLLFFLLFSFCVGFAQHVTVDWIQKKPHTIGRLITFDHNDNIIACGTYGNSAPNWSDIITIKYDSLGNTLWTTTYDDTLNNGTDRPMALAIDTFNNVYVAGVTNLPYDFTFTNPQGVLIKYNAQGIFQWKRSWGNAQGFSASFNSMKLVNNKDIYVSGYANPITTGDPHSLLMKYDSSGIIQWVHVDSATVENYISQIETDKAGNIYAVGTTTCCLPQYKMRLERYRPNGTRQWEYVLIDSLYTYGYGETIVIDDSSNCYLHSTISYNFSPSGYDQGIAKIDSSGNKKWFSPFAANPPFYIDRSISNVLINSKNELFCKGTLTNSNGELIIQLLNLNPISGNINWVNSDTALRTGGIGQLFYDTLGILSNGFNTNASGELACVISLSNQFNGDTLWTASLFGGRNYYLYTLLFKNSNYYLYGSSYDPNLGHFEDSLILVKLNLSQLLTSKNEDLENEGGVFVYPNPANEIINVSVNDESVKIKKLTLYSITGEAVLTATNRSSSVNILTLPKGLYILEVITSKGVEREKIIKQ